MWLATRLRFLVFALLVIGGCAQESVMGGPPVSLLPKQNTHSAAWVCKILIDDFYIDQSIPESVKSTMKEMARELERRGLSDEERILNQCDQVREVFEVLVPVQPVPKPAPPPMPNASRNQNYRPAVLPRGALSFY